MTMIGDDGISSAEVVERLNGRITYRQLDYWIRVGRVTPSVCEADGPGTGRRWSEADVVALHRILDMLERHDQEITRLSSGQMWDDLHAEWATLHRDVEVGVGRRRRPAESTFHVTVGL